MARHLCVAGRAVCEAWALNNPLMAVKGAYKDGAGKTLLRSDADHIDFDGIPVFIFGYNHLKIL